MSSARWFCRCVCNMSGQQARGSRNLSFHALAIVIDGMTMMQHGETMQNIHTGSLHRSVIKSRRAVRTIDKAPFPAENMSIRPLM